MAVGPLVHLDHDWSRLLPAYRRTILGAPGARVALPNPLGGSDGGETAAGGQAVGAAVAEANAALSETEGAAGSAAEAISGPLAVASSEAEARLTGVDTAATKAAEQLLVARDAAQKFATEGTIDPNALGAVRAIDPDIVRLAKSFNASRTQVFWKIEFPASLPPFFAGLRIAATLAVIGVVVGEIVGGNTGLGYLLTFGEGSGNTAMVFVTIIMLTIIGIVLYGAIVAIENRVLHWLPGRARPA